jgi:hypothetical protein
MQRGASPGGNRGDIGVTLFYDTRAARWANISANLGYIYNSSVKGEFPNGTFTLLDRGDELRYNVGVDFPVNRYFQPILEYGQTIYVGGRTVNVFENDPFELLGGVRIFPARWWGLGFAYRYHANSQDDVEDFQFQQRVTLLDFPRIIANPGPGIIDTSQVIIPTITLTSNGNLASAFRPSTDPHGFIFQIWAGRRNARGQRDIPKAFVDVTAVDFDQTEVILPCAPGQVSKSGGCPDDRTVGVRTSATNPDNDVLTYNYTVSGGRIVGSGANVNWDLSGVRAGTYTITAAVDNGCGFCGKTQTKTITVRDCPDCITPCQCPTSITVTGPAGLTDPGSDMNFTANVVGGTQDSVTYNWTVSAGTISSGQGTSAITVATDRSMAGQTVTATVTIGNLCADCNNTASASGEIRTLPDRRKIDEFTALPYDDIKLRFQNLQVEMANDPTATAYIITYGSGKARTAQDRGIERAIDFLKLDRSRIRIVDGGAGDGTVRTEVWIVPAGADPPTP